MNTNFRKSVLAGWAALVALACFAYVVQSTPRLGPRTYEAPTTKKSEASTGSDSGAHFSWADVIPSDNLKWVDCYLEHQCARLNMPLNYSEPDGEKAVIAMTRYPAAVPADSPLYRGPVLFNPGGPGGSGVTFIALAGSALAQIVGPQFDVIGFDPRGVAHSTPRVSLFETDVERVLWDDAVPRELNASEDGVARAWARAQINGRLAAERAGEYLPHVNTENTARDMLRIVEAHGMEKLQYWGISYGSVLGAVFATLFPDKVERIVIDGVVDAENYFDTLWSHNLFDTDRALQAFFDGCVAAGPAGCAFYAPTAEAISQNLTTLYESIRARPTPVHTGSGYGLVDFSFLRALVFSALYWPLTLFSPLADILAGLAREDGAPIFELFPQPPFQCSCDPAEHQFDAVPDATVAIICNDGRTVPSDFGDIEQYYAGMTKTSSWGSMLASVRIACSGWPDFPKKHFQGPVGANTSIPMLIIGNTADPITPLWAQVDAAEKTAKAFPGSVVLTQDCPGHTSLAAPSPCTWGHIREYFRSGTLPAADTVCPVIGSPFPDGDLLPHAQTVLSATERRVFDAFTTMQWNGWLRKFIL
ncbi:TAP-like protein-domain-containing protein [Mycena rosella]|uniref:TAP-like protein-domain-containing protein n=1 Tax=Mycena rosella TaxID=1033263 RepID=A0AAD7GDF3_MYCRO|nr:TAP-like protein-domain-containing protein [Mycena rosella]